MLKKLQFANKLWLSKAIVSVLSIGLIVYGGTLNNRTKKQNSLLSEENSSLKNELAVREEAIYNLETLLADRESTIEQFEDTIESVSRTVGTLQKLSETDKELLMKYSKVYFLNENYIPSSLREIPNTALYTKDRTTEIHSKVYPYLEDMMSDAKKAGHELLIASAYRSFDRQASLKAGYVVQYGSGANQFSADQGYSEHQLGTTVDFTTTALGANLSGLESDKAYEWLINNAYKYGFVLSYPKNNAYYKFEPWHWRFVGLDLAKYLHIEKKNFYDVDQRKIDNYLITIFD